MDSPFRTQTKQPWRLAFFDIFPRQDSGFTFSGDISQSEQSQRTEEKPSSRQGSDRLSSSFISHHCLRYAIPPSSSFLILTAFSPSGVNGLVCLKLFLFSRVPSPLVILNPSVLSRFFFFILAVDETLLPRLTRSVRGFSEMPSRSN